MIYPIQQKIAIAGLSILFILNAQGNTLKEFCSQNINACGITFTSMPAPPDTLTTANCYSAVPVTYVIENEGQEDTVINFDLVDLDSLGADAVIIDGTSTCSDGQTLNSLASCTIVLDFAPCQSGSLNRDLTVTPVSTQRPLVLALETTVGTSAFVYCE